MASAWDNRKQKYIQIKTGQTLVLTFEDDEPEVSPAKYDNTQYVFDVNGTGEQFRNFSEVLMDALDPHRPLGGKKLKITRTGENTDTAYEVIEVKDEE